MTEDLNVHFLYMYVLYILDKAQQVSLQFNCPRSACIDFISVTTTERMADR